MLTGTNPTTAPVYLTDATTHMFPARVQPCARSFQVTNLFKVYQWVRRNLRRTEGTPAMAMNC
jgi:hypothetical protein